MHTTDDAMSWSEHIARISAQIDELKVWLDSEQRSLYSRLEAQIGSLQSEIAKLLDMEVASGTTGTYASQLAKQIEALRARGDAVYDLLLTELTEPSQRAEPSRTSARDDRPRRSRLGSQWPPLAVCGGRGRLRRRRRGLLRHLHFLDCYGGGDAFRSPSAVP